MNVQVTKDGGEIQFKPNGGSGTMEDQVFASGVVQNLNTNTYTNGDIPFLWWNTEPDGSGKIYAQGELVNNLGVADNDVVTLYAMWGHEYNYPGDNVFDGTNHIDTGLKLFSSENINKNFEISFEINDYTFTKIQATLISAMNESGSPWPGFVYRVSSNQNQYEISANVKNGVSANPKYSTSTTSKVTLSRYSNVLYVKINDGTQQKVVDFSEIASPFDAALSIGSSLDANGNPQRYFTGTMSNIKIIVYE